MARYLDEIYPDAIVEHVLSVVSSYYEHIDPNRNMRSVRQQNRRKKNQRRHDAVMRRKKV